jgi:ceramide glucosyltransferase
MAEGTVIVVTAAVAGALHVALLAFKATLALYYARRYPRPRADGDLSAATIVQPILSGDPDLGAALSDNLASLPEARFLWMVDDSDSVGQEVTATLMRSHPGHRIERCLCADPPPGINPKLLKLERARSMVSEGAFVVVDDDTRVTRIGIAALLAGLAGDTITTGLPCYLDRGHLPSRLVAQFVNNNAALTYLPMLVFAPPPTINGMTYAAAASTLASLGGFTPLLGHVADDLAVAERVRETGGTIRQTPFPQFVATSVRDWRHYWTLMHRWFVFATLLVRQQSAAYALLIGVLHGMPPVLLWILVVSALTAPGVLTLAILISVVAARAATLLLVQWAITGRSRHAAAVSIAAELLQPVHMVHALCDSRIRWRTRHYTVRAHDDFGTA